jgi:FlaA1/EpsC-like NDP-sugar epimerase
MFENKKVLVTGACGSVGGELVRQLLQNEEYNPAEVVGIDNNETALFFSDQAYLNDKRAKFFVCDIRDEATLEGMFEGVDIVFHTAALKHVVLCERTPSQAVNTNIIGCQNVISAATKADVEKVIFTSSDKAVNPTNVMGTSKLMGERLMTAANSCKKGDGPIFASTRFGNVLGSSGSVIPIFFNQIASGGPISLTDTEMTRFVMSLEQSVKLVIDSSQLAKGGEVFITKMPVIKIRDLAKAMIVELAPQFGYQTSDIRIDIIGSKPGEKLYEELMSSEETRRAIELEDYFAVAPAFKGIYQNISYDYEKMVSDKVDNPYISSEEVHLSVDEITAFLNENRLLNKPSDSMSTRYWPGDKEENK